MNYSGYVPVVEEIIIRGDLIKILAKFTSEDPHINHITAKSVIEIYAIHL